MTETPANSSLAVQEAHPNLDVSIKKVSADAETIGGCKLTKQLGRGAMGIVYLAEQIAVSNRPVALKVMDPRFANDPVYTERFIREARSVEPISHINVIKVYSYGLDRNWRYIISEYADGGSVQDLLNKKPDHRLDIVQALNIINQASKGLVVAHSRGLTHRDIKPDNLMLTTRGIVKLADFGLAKISDAGPAMTQAETIVGTPHYMSPEQARGMRVDGRSDLYALGVTLYRLLTGEVPFDAENSVGVLIKHVSAQRPDPVDKRSDVPRAVSNLVMKLMAIDANDRYESARELVVVLTNLIYDLSNPNPRKISPPPELMHRIQHYRPYPKENFESITRREVPENVRARLWALAERTDAGVFIPTRSPFPQKTLIEAVYNNKEGHMRAFGLVKFSYQDQNTEGMAVTFVKKAPLNQTEQSSEKWQAVDTVKHNRNLPEDPVLLIHALTRSPIQAKIIRFYYANINRAFGVQNLATLLGVNVQFIAGFIQDYIAVGMFKVMSDKTLLFVYPENHELLQQINNWIQIHGAG